MHIFVVPISSERPSDIVVPGEEDWSLSAGSDYKIIYSRYKHIVEQNKKLSWPGQTISTHILNGYVNKSFGAYSLYGKTSSTVPKSRSWACFLLVLSKGDHILVNSPVMTLCRNYSREALCVREIKNEVEKELSLTCGVFMTRDLLHVPVHSKRKFVRIILQKQNYWKAKKASRGYMLLYDSHWHQRSLHTCLPVKSIWAVGLPSEL